jgi:hypothetical protein
MIQCPVVAQGYRASSSAEMLSIRNTAIAPRLRRSLLESWWRAGRSRGSAGGPTCAPARCGTGALLAARSPPRESRWRVILPEDAGTGATPHSAANEASLRSRCGLVPAVTSNWAAVSGPTP